MFVQLERRSLEHEGKINNDEEVLFSNYIVLFQTAEGAMVSIIK